MAGMIENYFNFEDHAVVRFLQAEGVSQNKIHSRLLSAYGQNVSSRWRLSVWLNKFKYGRTALKKHRG
jgi:hypothetical protein